MNPIRLLYVAEASAGGIAEYALYQVNALRQAIPSLGFLCRPDFPSDRLDRIDPIVDLPVRPRKASRLQRLAAYVQDSRQVARSILVTAVATGAEYVLLDCFREYLSPLWIGPLRQARREGIRFGVVAHDPVRDFVVGPGWWHNFCIRTAYSIVDDVFVHDDSRIDWGGRAPAGVSVHLVPHGPYAYGEATRTREEMRRHYGLDAGDRVFLAFGQVRDNKNLDCFIKAMPHLPPEVKLLVAGSGTARSQRPTSFYLDLAGSLGVADRCVFDFRYIPDGEVPDLLAMADAVLMTYSKSFVSASGVMNTAVAAGLPILASGGEGPLKTAMTSYRIGEWVDTLEPDSIAAGVLRLLSRSGQYEFSCCLSAQSWAKNAGIILGAAFGGPSS